MAATIQHIELPKKPRALDSSTSVQEVSQELVTNGSMEADANWSNQNTPTTNERSSAQANGGTYSRKVVGNSSGDGIKSDTFSLVEGRTYRVEFYYYLTSGSNTLLARLQDGDGSDLGVSEVFGTKDAWTKITFTRVAENTGDASYFKIYQNQIGDSTFYVDDVSVKEIDTFSNNNHGKIYSGRALEFDGVADYLSVSADVATDFPSLTITGSSTISCWINLNSLKDTPVWVASHTNGDQRLGLTLGNEGEIAFVKYGGGGEGYTNKSGGVGTVNINTWYRVVCVLSSGSQKIYVNKHELTGAAKADTNNLASHSGNTFKIGFRNDVYFDGMISDLQVWDAAWSADDIAYDYANPESLALNASGSALTEGNLKLWYPMQDGHRGQQSYILDGANTGVVATEFSDDFSTDTTGSYNGQANTVITYDSSNDLLKITYNEVAGNKLKRDGTLVAGKQYKTTFRARGTRATNFKSIGPSGVKGAVKNPVLTTSFQDYEFIFIADVQSIRLYQGNGDIGDYLEITDIVVQPINDKHHATTVFYGDTLWDTAASTNGSVSNWTAFGSNTLATDSGAVRGTFVDNISGVYIYLRDAKDLSSDLTVGRTYQLQYDVKVNSGSVTPKIAVSGGTTYSGSAVTSTTFVTNTIDFVCESADGHYFYTDQMHTGEIVYLDNFSLKEVGVATGWTDADQQLDIAQPALQSYNEMLYGFSSTNADPSSTNVKFADNDALDVGADSFSISLWFRTDSDNSNHAAILKKGGWSATGYSIGMDSSQRLAINTSDSSVNNNWAYTTTTIEKAKWYHVVGVWNRTTDLQYLYLNGILQTMAGNNDISANGNLDNASKFQFYSTGGTTGFFSGCITEIALFKDVAFSSDKVLELYNEGKALDATLCSQAHNLDAYWRNNGLSTWKDLSTNSNDSESVAGSETLLIPQGVDGSRDAQGFLMNRERNTSSLNLPHDKSYSGISSTGSYVEINDHDGLDFGNNPFSIECWVKPLYRSKGSSSLNTIFMLGKQINEATSAGLCTSSGSILFYIGGTSLAHSYSTNDWHHVVGVREGTGTNETKIYVNGALSTTGTRDASIVISNAYNPKVGFEENPTRGYEDSIDGIKVYNKALDSTEVTRNYKATKGSHRN